MGNFGCVKVKTGRQYTKEKLAEPVPVSNSEVSIVMLMANKMEGKAELNPDADSDENKA